MVAGGSSFLDEVYERFEASRPERQHARVEDSRHLGDVVRQALPCVAQRNASQLHARKVGLCAPTLREIQAVGVGRRLAFSSSKISDDLIASSSTKTGPVQAARSTVTRVEL